jgi:putative hydrolase of the HAD superfamily
LKPCYRLGLLSNTNPWHFEYGIRTVEVFDLFDAVSLSYRVQAMKPDRRIYLHALGQLNTAPHTCVFIDDIPANVEAAKDLGMHGILYTGHPSLMNSLRQLRIVVD